jgi:hypothetical protein
VMAALRFAPVNSFRTQCRQIGTNPPHINAFILRIADDSGASDYEGRGTST